MLTSSFTILYLKKLISTDKAYFRYETLKAGSHLPKNFAFVASLKAF